MVTSAPSRCRRVRPARRPSPGCPARGRRSPHATCALRARSRPPRIALMTGSQSGSVASVTSTSPGRNVRHFRDGRGSPGPLPLAIRSPTAMPSTSTSPCPVSVCTRNVASSCPLCTVSGRACTMNEPARPARPWRTRCPSASDGPASRCSGPRSSPPTAPSCSPLHRSGRAGRPSASGTGRLSWRPARRSKTRRNSLAPTFFQTSDRFPAAASACGRSTRRVPPVPGRCSPRGRRWHRSDHVPKARSRVEREHHPRNRFAARAPSAARRPRARPYPARTPCPRGSGSRGGIQAGEAAAHRIDEFSAHRGR